MDPQPEYTLHQRRYTDGKWAFEKMFFIMSCCCSVAKLCLILCDPMDCSMSGSHDLHCLPEFAQIHVRWVHDVIWPSHPLLLPSAFAFTLSQHQGLFQWVDFSYHVAKVLGASASASVRPMNTQGWFPLGLSGLISLLSKVHVSCCCWC